MQKIDLLTFLYLLMFGACLPAQMILSVRRRRALFLCGFSVAGRCIQRWRFTSFTMSPLA